MQVEITAKQLNHFREFGVLALENVIDEKTFETIKNCRVKLDAWRYDEIIYKGVASKLVGQVIFELVKKRPIRILTDSIVENETVEASHMPFQGIMMGAVIPFEENLVTFFTPEKSMTIAEKSYVVVYGENNARFVMRDEVTSLTKQMKDLGYSFGDRLKTKNFPVFFK